MGTPFPAIMAAVQPSNSLPTTFPNSLEVSSGIGSLTGQREALHLHLPSDPETDRTSPPVQISLAPGFSDTLQGDFMESHRVLLVLQASCNPGGLRSTPMF